MKHLAGLSPVLIRCGVASLYGGRKRYLMKIQKRCGSGQHFIVLVHGAQPPDRAFEQDVQHGKAVQQKFWSQNTHVSGVSQPDARQ